MEYEVKTDAGKNRLYLTMAGFPTEEDVVDVKNRIEKALAGLKTGFTLMNDSKNFKTADQALQVKIGEIMKLVAAKQPSKVARIMGAVAGMQFGRISKEAGYEAANFQTKEEAEAYLDS